MRIVSPVDENLSEIEIQRAFEDSIESIEKGLTYITSFLTIGTGIIDTLAVDEDNNAVIIEFKKVGNFSRDALIQLMNYYAWFAKDPNHMDYLRDIIKKKKPDCKSVEDVRLIAVVKEVEDDVKNACWALEPYIKLITYSIFKDQAGDNTLIPLVLADTSIGAEQRLVPPKNEEDHLKDHENFRNLYHEIKKTILEKVDPNVKINPTPQNYISFARKRNFVALRFKDQWIRLDMLLKKSDVNNSPRYTDYPSGDFGYVHVGSKNEIDDELVSWLKKAYDKAG